jgi:hypothetical protein
MEQSYKSESSLLFIAGLKEIPDITKSKDMMEWEQLLADTISAKSYLKEHRSLYNTNTRRKTIIDALKHLASFLCEKREPERKRTAFIYYLGHGNQTRDLNGDEEDGMDELWCLRSGESILDDEISLIFKDIPENSKVILISDSCSSGTMIDVKLNNANWITYSSCADNENAFCSFDGGIVTIFGMSYVLKQMLEDPSCRYLPSEFYERTIKRIKIVTQNLEMNAGNKSVLESGWFE